MNYLWNEFRLIEFRADKDLGNRLYFSPEKSSVSGTVLHLQDEEIELLTYDTVFLYTQPYMFGRFLTEYILESPGGKSPASGFPLE